MLEKRCSYCKELKIIDEFYFDKRRKDGHYPRCKKCACDANRKYQKANPDKLWAKKNPERARETSKLWKELNSDKVNETRKRYRKAHPEKQRERKRKWRKENPEKVREIRRLYFKRHPEKAREKNRRWKKANLKKVREYHKLWTKNNIEKVRNSRNKRKLKVYSTPKGHLSQRMSSSIGKALKGNKSGRHWETLVNYTVEDLKKHLERLFLPGMTWENYGPVWHIDHKIPVKAHNFEKPEDRDFGRCWALKNLQPLWAMENCLKQDKIEKHFQPSLVFPNITS